MNLHIFILAGLYLTATEAANTDLEAQQSLSKLDVYGLQRNCAKSCFWGWNGGPIDMVGERLGCSIPYNWPAQNICYCRADLQSAGEAYLSSCVYSSCAKNSVDLMTATSLYRAYCTPKITPQAAEVDTTPSSTPTLASEFPIGMKFV